MFQTLGESGNGSKHCSVKYSKGRSAEKGLIMKISSIFFSPCGGTRNVMQAILKDVKTPVTSCDMTLPGTRKDTHSFAEDDFVLFGFPVYGGRMPVNSENLFKFLKGRGTPCALIAVYGNRAYDGALLDMHKLAVANGFFPVAAIAAIAEHSLAPQLATARPDKEDRTKLAAWGLQIMDFAFSGMRLETVPGEYPDWNIPAGMSPYPVTDLAKCTRCGICAEVCPTGAIPKEEPYLTDNADCIFCGACAKYCPEKARVMGNEIFHEFGRPHLLEAAKRKEPELFMPIQTLQA